MSVGAPSATAIASRLLAGYLCGTHSGLHAARKPVRATAVVEAIRASRLEGRAADGVRALETRPWSPGDEHERRLHAQLTTALQTDAVLDLIVYGSIARGTTTGYSDVDAVLVIRDECALDRVRLRELRGRVLAAERAVTVYQPLQHHGLQIATPGLLTRASAALGMPSETLSSAVSLFGRPVNASFEQLPVPPDQRFLAFAAALRRTQEWPRHIWELHRAISMFELVPALYLQGRGLRCEKHESFRLARTDFPALWAPFDVLGEVRDGWPRVRHPTLQRAATVLRNPWTAVAAWRRLPAPAPAAITQRLGAEVLEALHQILRAMESAVGDSSR